MNNNKYLGLGVLTLDRVIHTLDGCYTRQIYGHVIRRQIDVPGKGLQQPMLYVFRRRPKVFEMPTQIAQLVIADEHRVNFLPGLPVDFQGFKATTFSSHRILGSHTTRKIKPCEQSP